MTDPGKLPTSGYNFESIYSNHQSLLLVAKSSDLPTESNLLFGWDWRLLSDSHFEVTVQFGIDPTIDRTEEIRVTMCGRFTPVGDRQEVPLESFVQYHAPAILMPFIRDAVANLTSRGFFGSLLLPPINVQVLMEQRDPAMATAANQLAETSMRQVSGGRP